MIKAAETQGKRIGVQGRRYEGYMVWINALIASGGGQIIENPEARRRRHADGRVAGRDVAAEIVGELARSSAAPADMSTAGEEEARSVFQGDDGSFMVNWPYVYAAAQDGGRRMARSTSRSSTTSAGPATRRWRPARRARRRSAASTSAIGAFTKHPDEALAAAKCITSLESNIEYMVKSGNPAARAAAYDDPKVREAFPMADLIRDSINGAGPRPGHARTTATCRCRCSAPGTRRRASTSRRHTGGDRRLHGAGAAAGSGCCDRPPTLRRNHDRRRPTGPRRRAATAKAEVSRPSSGTSGGSA